MVDTLGSVQTTMIHTLVIIYTAVGPHPAWDTHTPGTQDTHTLTCLLHDTVQEVNSVVSIFSLMWHLKLAEPGSDEARCVRVCITWDRWDC